MKSKHANRSSWKKGQSGNKKGAPLYGNTFEEMYKRALTKSVAWLQKQLERSDLQAKDIMIIKDVIKATDGDSYSLTRIQNRVEGKAVQKIINEDSTMAKIDKEAGGDPHKAMELLTTELENRGIFINEKIKIKTPDEN